MKQSFGWNDGSPSGSSQKLAYTLLALSLGHLDQAAAGAKQLVAEPDHQHVRHGDRTLGDNEVYGLLGPVNAELLGNKKESRGAAAANAGLTMHDDGCAVGKPSRSSSRKESLRWFAGAILGGRNTVRPGSSIVRRCVASIRLAARLTLLREQTVNRKRSDIVIFLILNE